MEVGGECRTPYWKNSCEMPSCSTDTRFPLRPRSTGLPTCEPVEMLLTPVTSSVRTSPSDELPAALIRSEPTTSISCGTSSGSEAVGVPVTVMSRLTTARIPSRTSRVRTAPRATSTLRVSVP